MEHPRLESELRELHPAAFGWALACCGRDTERAADVLQIAYCRVLGGSANFSGRSSLRTFLFGVVRMVALEEGQRRAREARRSVRLHDDHLELGDSNPGQIERLERRERCDELSAGLARLSLRQGEVLHLVFYQGLTLDEAARVMGVRPGSAARHYDRGKRALRALLTPPTKTTP